MRRIIGWLSATAVLVALLIGYQFAYAGATSGDGDKGRACSATATASADPTATHCEPTGGDRTGGDTSTHIGKPGENK